ncbi:MAG: MFS transporter [Sphaerochaetaceae bacterium]
MATILLVVIYLSFISLGLPDSLLGSAWPVMGQELGVPVSYAGVLSMIVSGGTIVSSLFSGHVLSRFGTAKVTLASVAMTAVALLGFSFGGSFMALCLLALPLGLGAGSVDSGLNSFVASHFKARHMSWLHCFWGIGASLSPLIMSAWITRDGQWRNGYLTVSILQSILVLILAVALPLWKRVERQTGFDTERTVELQRIHIARASLWPALLSFFCYCSIETTTGVWGASYLVWSRGLEAATAARWVSLFYLGITAGRFLAGFATMKFSAPTLILVGQALCGIGATVLLLPLPDSFAAFGMACVGFGLAPIFPAMLQETPSRFGLERAQKNMGYQMAAAYIGSTFTPPLFGLVSSRLSLSSLPYLQLFFLVVMIFSCGIINRQMGRSL